MSTKQATLYTLMIFFLAILLFAMGAWLKSSMELNQKKNILAALKETNVGLKHTLEGGADIKGLINEVKDPQEGLEKRASEVLALVPLLKSNPGDPAAPGMDELEKKYQDLQQSVADAWTKDAVAALNLSKKDREQQEADMTGALKRLADQRKEKEDKEGAAIKDLEQEESTKETELKKIAQETSKMTQDLETVRFEHEATQQKVTEVSRDLSKVKAIVKQGLIVGADKNAKIAYIDLGTRSGVRNGMLFDIYSGMHRHLVRKGKLEVSDAGPFSSKCILLLEARENRWDPISGWIPDSPAKIYSPFVAGGPDETDAVELVARKTVKDKIEAIRIEKIAKEQGLEAAEEARAEGKGSTVPPSDLSLSLTPVDAGDWIFNADFIPIVTTDEFHAQMRDELKTMRDVNVGSLTFYIADTVRTYRKEYIKRLCDHNGCKVSESMNPNVNIVVAGAGFTDLDLVKERNASKKGKENLKDDDKNLIATEAALEDAKKYAADVLPEDEVEAFFDRRQRKQELIRGKVAQPGRSTFFIAGKTRNRSPELLAKYIQDNGGLVATDIEAKVDYIVVGESPDDTFVEKIKKLGLKIVREEELPTLLGIK